MIESIQDTLTTLSQNDSLASMEEQLQALYQPDPVPFSFDTIGWKILGVLILLLFILAAYKRIRKYILNAYRRDGLQNLNEIQKRLSAKNGADQLAEVFVVLKHLAMARYGRERAGCLHGRDWLLFLEETGKDVSILSKEKEISDALYQKENPNKEVILDILTNAKKWVKSHA